MSEPGARYRKCDECGRIMRGMADEWLDDLCPRCLAKAEAEYEEAPSDAFRED